MDFFHPDTLDTFWSLNMDVVYYFFHPDTFWSIRGSSSSNMLCVFSFCKTPRFFSKTFLLSFFFKDSLLVFLFGMHNSKKFLCKHSWELMNVGLLL